MLRAPAIAPLNRSKSTLALYLAAGLMVFAWGFIGAAGWWLAQPDLVTRLVMIVFHVGATILAALGLKHAAPNFSFSWRGAPIAAIGIICVAVTAYGGHQGLAMIEQRAWAAYDAYEAAQPARAEAAARLAAIEAEIRALPPVPLTYPNGAPIGVNTRDRLMVDHNQNLDRQRRAQREAQAALSAATPTPVPRPSLRMSGWQRNAFMLVAEIIEVFGFWGIGLMSARWGAEGTASRKRAGKTSKRRQPKPAYGREKLRGAPTPIVPLAFGASDEPRVEGDREWLGALPQPQRRALALKAANPAMSLRAIEAATGVSKATLSRLWKRANKTAPQPGSAAHR